MVYVWLVVFILGLIVEALIPALVSVWFSIGALASTVAALCGANLVVQMVLFFLISAILLLLFIFFFKKKFKGKEMTNTNSLLHSSALVEKTIKEKGRGRVLVSSMNWQAEEESGEEIEKGEWVKVIAIKGVTLVVKKEKENEEEKSSIKK